MLGKSSRSAGPPCNAGWIPRGGSLVEHGGELAFLTLVLAHLQGLASGLLLHTVYQCGGISSFRELLLGIRGAPQFPTQ